MTNESLYGPAMEVKTVPDADTELRFLAQYAMRRWKLTQEEAIKTMKENIITYSKMHKPEALDRMRTLFAIPL